MGDSFRNGNNATVSAICFISHSHRLFSGIHDPVRDIVLDKVVIQSLDIAELTPNGVGLVGTERRTGYLQVHIAVVALIKSVTIHGGRSHRLACHIGQRGAILKSGLTNILDTAANGHRSQMSAAVERAKVNRSDSIRDDNFCEPAAIAMTKGVSANVGETIGKRHIIQIWTIKESIIVNVP